LQECEFYDKLTTRQEVSVGNTGVRSSSGGLLTVCAVRTPELYRSTSRSPIEQKKKADPHPGSNMAQTLEEAVRIRVHDGWCWTPCRLARTAARELFADTSEHRNWKPMPNRITALLMASATLEMAKLWLATLRKIEDKKTR
jgi:hypothetical protein